MATILAFHAHPDDEVLLTGGTLAAAAAAGDHVVLVTATRGEAGLTAAGTSALGQVRERELCAAAAVLGVHEVVLLGYPDSGMNGERRDGFAHRPVDALAEQLLELLHRHDVDVLLGYDRAGGYGHPDHRQVHRVARHAADRMRSVRLLEATVDRAALQRALRMVQRVPFVTASWDPELLRTAFTAPEDITHRVDVRPFVRAKQAAMAEHRTQLVGGTGDRTLKILAGLPRPVAGRVLGTEWFTDPAGRTCAFPLPVASPSRRGRATG